MKIIKQKSKETNSIYIYTENFTKTIYIYINIINVCKTAA